MRRAALFLMLAFVLWSCATDPRREAEAFATQQQAETQAQAAQQQLEQDAEAHELWMSRANEVSEFISAMMTTTLIAVMFVVLTAGASFGVGLSFAMISGGVGVAKRQLARPMLEQVRLDPVTRQYPLIITKVTDGKYALTNPNVGSTTILYDRNPADRLMIQAMANTQHDGALAYQARLSHQPGQVAQIEAPRIVEM